MDDYQKQENIYPEKIRICMPGKKGKVLALNVDGDVTCSTRGNDLKDDEWIFSDVDLPTEEKGYHIVSANYKMALDYNPKDGEQVNAVPYKGNDHTIWRISNNNEIYSFDNEGEKKYLWSLLGNLYVTHDEYLAENWELINLEGKEAAVVEPKKPDFFVLFLIVLILFLICYVIYVRYGKT